MGDPRQAPTAQSSLSSEPCAPAAPSTNAAGDGASHESSVMILKKALAEHTSKQDRVEDEDEVESQSHVVPQPSVNVAAPNMTPDCGPLKADINLGSNFLNLPFAADTLTSLPEMAEPDGVPLQEDINSGSKFMNLPCAVDTLASLPEIEIAEPYVTPDGGPLKEATNMRSKLASLPAGDWTFDTLGSLPEYLEFDDDDDDDLQDGPACEKDRQYSIEQQFSALDAAMVKRRLGLEEEVELGEASDGASAATEVPSDVDVENSPRGAKHRELYRWSMSSTLSSASAVHEAAGTVVLNLDNTDGMPFGLGFKLRPDHLLIIKLCAEGLVPQWNKANPEQMIKPGDHVVKVNDVCGLMDGGSAMDAELDKLQVHCLEVRRSS